MWLPRTQTALIRILHYQLEKMMQNLSLQQQNSNCFRLLEQLEQFLKKNIFLFKVKGDCRLLG